MSEEEIEQLRAQAREDRALMRRAADALAQIDRGANFEDHHADVLAALRIRIEGKPRGSLEDLLTTVGDIGGKDLGAALAGAEEKPSTDWPVVEEKKKEWPGL